MKRKLLSLLMALTMALSLVPVSALAASYGDTAGHWAQAAIERWSGYGIVTGDDSGFRPNDNMTRAEAATVFSRLFSLTDATAKSTFTDVKAGDWYYDAVNKCVNAGIMNGVGDGMMKPNSPLTREMFFVMFARGLGIKEQSATKGLKADGAAWSAGYINALTDKGYVKGMDGKVNATANINRASVMALLDQTITTYANEAGATVTGTGKGVTLIAAEGVTVTGNVDTLVVAGSSEAETVAFAGDEDTAYASAVYAAPRFSVIIRNAVIALLNIIAPAKVELEGTTSVSSVAVTQTAAETTVDVGASASVAAVETAAADTKVEGAGKVEAVAATGEAADTVAVTTPNTEVATSKSVENADGSTTTTVTESKNDAAGKPTGETKTETTVKETTAADGTKTTEKTATATVTNAAGKVTETTKTESTVTEKTASDGTKTTETAATVTKADGTGKVVETTKTESTVKETTASDGTKTTETAATVAKTDAAGRTETTKTDATVTEKTAANGTKTTETAATVAKTDASGKTETTTTTATATETTNANGSVTTATTATVEKTAADGTKTTDKVESTATATTNADGSTTTAKTETVATTGADGKTTTTKTESTATATVNANGTTTTATEAKVEKTDASGKTTTETVKSTETAKENADGSTTATTTTSTTDASGRTTTTTETKTSTEAESSVSGSTGAAASSADTSSTTATTPTTQTGGSSSSDDTTYYTVSFSPAGPQGFEGTTGSIASQTVAAGSTITLPSNGYMLAAGVTEYNAVIEGWLTEDSHFYEAGDSYTVTSSTTLYALWCIEVASGATLTIGESDIRPLAEAIEEEAPKESVEEAGGDGENGRPEKYGTYVNDFDVIVRSGGKVIFTSQEVAKTFMERNVWSCVEAGAELRIGTAQSSYAIVGTASNTDKGDHFLQLDRGELYFDWDNGLPRIVVSGEATIPAEKTWTNGWGFAEDESNENAQGNYWICLDFESELIVNGDLYVRNVNGVEGLAVLGFERNENGTLMTNGRGGSKLVFASAEKAVNALGRENVHAWIGAGAVVAVKYGNTEQAIVGYTDYTGVRSDHYVELSLDTDGCLSITPGEVFIGGDATVPVDKTWTNYWGVDESGKPVAPYSIMIGHGSTLTVDGTLKLADVNKSEEDGRRSLLVLGNKDNSGKPREPATLTINGTLDATGSMLEIADGATVTFNAKAVAPAARAIVARNAFAKDYNEATGVVGWDTLIKASYYYNGSKSEELTKYYASIKKLDMSNKSILECTFYDGTDVGSLAPFTGLEELNLSNTNITDIGALQKLGSLKKLDLSGNTFSTVGALANKTTIEELNLSNTGATHEWYGALITLGGLKKLDISQNQAITSIGPLTTAQGGNAFANNLQELNVSRTGLKVIQEVWNGTENSSALPALKTLYAQNLELTSISGLVMIVNATGFNATDITWDLLGSTLSYNTDNNNHITTIKNKFADGTFVAPYISNPAATEKPKSVTSLENWTNALNTALGEGAALTSWDWDKLITFVYWYETAKKDVDAMTDSTTKSSCQTSVTAAKTAIEKVTKLSMSGKNTSQYAISTGALTHFKNLTELDLSNTGITEAGGLVGLTKLTMLNLSGNSGLNSTMYGAFADMSVLTELDMSGTGITDIGGLTKTACAKSLEKLNISNTAAAENYQENKTAFPKLTNVITTQTQG